MTMEMEVFVNCKSCIYEQKRFFIKDFLFSPPPTFHLIFHIYESEKLLLYNINPSAICLLHTQPASDCFSEMENICVCVCVHIYLSHL